MKNCGKRRIDKKTGKEVKINVVKIKLVIPYDTINSKDEKGNHPAIFPEELVRHLYQKISNVKTGKILDKTCWIRDNS